MLPSDIVADPSGFRPSLEPSSPFAISTNTDLASTSNQLSTLLPVIGSTNVALMSRPGNPGAEPLVTTAESAQDVWLEEPSDLVHRHPDRPRQHQKGPPVLPQDPTNQRPPSPSRAESPASHQWSKNASYPLKGRRDRAHRPQLSERDSIFATHYLPSDSDTGTPKLPPVQDENNEHLILTPDHDEIHPPNRSVSMDVGIHTSHRIAATSTSPPPDSTDSSRSLELLAKQQDATPEREDLLHLRKTMSHGSHANAPATLEEETSQNGPSAPSLNDAASAGGHGTRPERSGSRGHRGRVEHSIEANLTNAEPTTNVRSRKSSHYLGLFKENTTSPDRKRRRGHGRHDESLEPYDHHATGADVTYTGSRSEFEPPPFAHPPSQDAALRASKSLSQLSLENDPLIEPLETEASQELESDDVKHPRRMLPPTLLEEIRNFHLTPGGARGSSFSKSIPTQIPERRGDYFSLHPADERLSSESEIRPHERQRSPGQFEDEEEENEQISSAVYYPHERVAISDTVDQLRFSDGQDDVQPFNISKTEDGHVLVPKRGNEQEANHVDISLRSKNDSRILHGDLQSPLDDLNEQPLNAISERSYDSTGDSEVTSAEDSGLSARDEESSVTDNAMTPTATPTQRHRYLRTRRKHAPVGAVELTPYRHQVGGHTTVFRFSRRAVCKQLNNRENEFYERIERRHPEMLMFLPRYIGVLNVTFSKNPKRPKILPGEHTESGLHDAKQTGEVATGDLPPPEAPEQPRIFSQKQVTGIIPKVVLEDNRHIIPADLFSGSQRPRSADGSTLRKLRFANDKAKTRDILSQRNSAEGMPSTVRLKHIKSWGATTVNRQLQEQVLREVFSRPAIHHHRRHARGHYTVPKNLDKSCRRPNLSEDHTASSRRTAPERNDPPISAAVNIAAMSDEGPGLSSSASTALDANRRRLQQIRTEEDQPRASSASRTRQVRRRHSGGGLQRRRSMDSKESGDLMFFDDDGYGGDGEDEIFSMESDPSMSSGPSTSQPPPSTTPELRAVPDGHVTEDAALEMTPTAPSRFTANVDNRFRLPINPKEAQTRKDERVQFFLLLEDLTAGMNKPCVLDLKMGTRQYGIEADEKKKKSQRRKCQTTTTQQLGVRLCGMQTWNVKRQEYSFEDKYFGRDLRSGREFQDALSRFLYDGVSSASIGKKIPVILEKLVTLESMIRKLKRYRLYASSLLILYDGEQTAAEKIHTADPQTGARRRHSLGHRVSDDGHNNMNVQIKIVDFANCVTGEDELPPNVRCPPRHPDDIDRGYLRGLRTLRMYFQRILQEVSKDEYVERGEGEALAFRLRNANYDAPAEHYWDDGVMESDPGEVSG